MLRKLDGELPVETRGDTGCDRGARAGEPGDHGDALAEADDQRIQDRHASDALLPRRHTIGDVEHAAGEHEGDADKDAVIIQAFEQILDRHDQHQRERGQNDHEEQTRARIPLPPLSGHRPQVQQRKSLVHHRDDILPVDHADGQQRAEMQQHVKKQMSFFGRRQAEKIVQDRQMTGTRNRQKLRQALNQSQQDRISNAHRINPHGNRKDDFTTFLW